MPPLNLADSADVMFLTLLVESLSTAGYEGIICG